MKVGLSFSRCVRDIVEGKVDLDDVLVIVARTDFDPHDDEQWQGIWQGYAGGSDANMMRGFFGGSHPEWAGFTDEYEGKFRFISTELYDTGRLHQPRQFGARPQRLPYYWLETFAPYEEIADNPATVKAWENYKMLAGLSNTNKTVRDDF